MQNITLKITSMTHKTKLLSKLAIYLLRKFYAIKIVNLLHSRLRLHLLLDFYL